MIDKRYLSPYLCSRNILFCHINGRLNVGNSHTYHWWIRQIRRTWQAEWDNRSGHVEPAGDVWIENDRHNKRHEVGQCIVVDKPTALGYYLTELHTFTVTKNETSGTLLKLMFLIVIEGVQSNKTELSIGVKRHTNVTTASFAPLRFIYPLISFANNLPLHYFCTNFWTWRHHWKTFFWGCCCWQAVSRRRRRPRWPPTANIFSLRTIPRKTDWLIMPSGAWRKTKTAIYG